MPDLRTPSTTLARLALACAVGATLGDFGELWAANAGRPELHLTAPPGWLIVPATLAGALGIPCYAFGYRVRVLVAVGSTPRLARSLGAASVVFAVLGGMVHLVTGVLIQTRAGGIADGLDPLEGILASGPIVVTLWSLALLAFVVTAALEAGLPQPWQERMRNPLFLTVMLTLAAALLPLPWRDIVGPAAFNIAHVVFFAGLARER